MSDRIMAAVDCKYSGKYKSAPYRRSGIQFVAQIKGVHMRQNNSYHITDGQKILMCDREFRELGQAATIECPAGGSIDLTYVNYGRTAPYAEVCNYGYGKDRSTCGPVDVITQRARDTCQGQSSCQLTYNGLWLWDTCYFTYKYFEVKYTCIPAGTTGKASTLLEITFLNPTQTS